jgi:hypothetical protein
MNFQKDDRVMICDQIWEKLSNDTKRTGRRGGTVQCVVRAEWGVFIRVMWDGRKTASNFDPDWLCADDPNKHTLPPSVLRKQRKEKRGGCDWVGVISGMGV